MFEKLTRMLERQCVSCIMKATPPPKWDQAFCRCFMVGFGLIIFQMFALEFYLESSTTYGLNTSQAFHDPFGAIELIPMSPKTNKNFQQLNSTTISESILNNNQQLDQSQQRQYSSPTHNSPIAKSAVVVSKEPMISIAEHNEIIS